MDHHRNRTSARTTDRRTADRRAADRRNAGNRTAGSGTTGSQGPGRRRTAGSVPPGRRDSRRPGAPGTAPLAALRRRERERQPRYWFADRLLLTLSGQKPVHWMLGHTLGGAYDQLVLLAPLAPLRPSGPASPGPGSPGPGSPGPGSPGPAPYVGRCDEYRPEPDVIEAFARIVYGDRVRALAFRLEQGPDDRWRCSAVELGLPALTT
ncbi:Rv3235 family protein [Streptomyces sp. bgisy100]|uniref:Rv3235 family protein n=1 Tax=Streptomyces sp. bgisy100 TaxID=3413783 RepID=UPI003D72C8A4